MKKYISILFLVVAFSISSYLTFQYFNKPQVSKPIVAAAQNKQETASSQVTAKPSSFNKSLYSLTDPQSLWVVVNKARGLQPVDFVPTGLKTPDVAMRKGLRGEESIVRLDTGLALEAMLKAAGSENIHLDLQSGYRSYSVQVSVYNSYVKRDGQASADTYSARPGFSEHQTGLAADLGSIDVTECNVATCFGETPEGKWLAANAYIYGFVIRYPAGKQAVTGYQPEPWHVRFVGKELSNEMHDQNIQTLEEFFNLPAAPGYTH